MDKAITGHTGLYCLLGSPVAHSASPQMHNEAFRLLGVDARYLAFDVTQETLRTAVDGLRAMGARGWNLTMPCKTAMAPLCDELTPVARLCGAVNTVANRGGRLVGTTTDGLGWVLSAKEAGVGVAGKRIVQLGCGGAGTSILAQCAVDGAAAIDVFKRKNASWDDTRVFAERVKAETSCQVVLHDIEDKTELRACIAEADVLLNTTSVGMRGAGGCLIPDASYLHAGLAVSDIIYEPRETELLRMAREAGCRTVGGMYMLLWQGAAAFEFWTGRKMPVGEIRAKYFAEA